MDCLFCKIAAGDIPSKKAYEDERILAFHDIQPQAPIHVLVIPRQHLSSANEVNESNSEIISHIFTQIPKIAMQVGLGNGYRVITNCGDDGCQSVKHLHFHLLGGKKLAEHMG